MNNKFKGYRWVSHISMANDTNIDTIGTYAYEDEDGAPESLEDAMNAAEDIVLVGFGIYSGRKLWQAPEEIQNEVRAFLEEQSTVKPINL
jgi:hypothetical protein|tara:strand:- start:79 stop:348 length:270 start_codon:yes stop_codon:yes gene_type:complete